jgi:hypothetical protein
MARNFISADQHTLPARDIGRLSVSAARAWLTSAAVAGFMVALPPHKARPADLQPQTTTSVDFNKKDGTLYIGWSGPVAPGMADYLRNAFGKYATDSHRLVLLLNSGGGQVEEGERVIHALEEMKQTHRLTTAVMHGKMCASMCVPIYLQGNDRLAARASLWVFHEVATRESDGTERMDMEDTLRLFRRYYVPAGVSAGWLKSILPLIKHANLWRTGGDLISGKTGIILHPLEDRTERVVAAPAAQERRATPSAARH